jgi:hypothetical protein
MKLPEILALGKYSPNDLIVSVSESNRKIDPIIERKIDAIWEAKKKEADENGKICYNGLSYRLNSLKKVGDKISLDFGIIEYKIREGVKKIPQYFNLPEEFYGKGCYSMTTVKTSDNHYLMVELSGKSMNKHTIDLLGGIMETNIEAKTGADIFQSLFIELEEEACIDKSDIEKSYLRSVFLGINTNVCFYFEVGLNISSSELQNRFKTKNKDQDIKSLKDFSPDKYMQVLKNHESKNKQFILEILNI